MSFLFLRLAGLCLALAALVLPLAAAAKSWSHGAWRVQTRDDGGCEVLTGGDGTGSLWITVGKGGYDPVLIYQPVYFRGEAPPLKVEDEIALIFDGKTSWLSDEMFVAEWSNHIGEPQVDASLTSGFTGEAVSMLRKGDVLVVGVARGGEAKPYDTYMLDGFTANWLKAADWCGFDPNRLPGS